MTKSASHYHVIGDISSASQNPATAVLDSITDMSMKHKLTLSCMLRCALLFHLFARTRKVLQGKCYHVIRLLCLKKRKLFRVSSLGPHFFQIELLEINGAVTMF